MADTDIARMFLDFSREKLRQYSDRVRTCVESLPHDQVWWRPNEASNSIGNLILHLNGNVQQWIVASFERLEDTRNRPQEFGERERISTGELLQKLETTIRRAEDVLSRLTDADLRQMYRIQGYTVSGLHAVYQVVEHFGQHYGQIAYITKSLRSEDLGFSRELNKTGRA